MRWGWIERSPGARDWTRLDRVAAALKDGGFFGAILPTTNQVSRLLGALHQYNFAFVDVCEIILRYYKPVSDRFRPVDRMVAHTGYLTFARRIEPCLDERSRQLLEETGALSKIEPPGQEEEIQVPSAAPYLAAASRSGAKPRGNPA